MKYPALLALFLCAFFSLPVQAADGKPPSYRFLILVDTSSSMKRMDEFTPTIVHDLIMGGIQGRMRGGDLYGVWTFNDLVDVTFTEPTVWQPDLAKTQAQTVDRYLRAVKYQGKAKLEEAVRRIKQVVLQSDELTVLIIHDGSGVMFGTPYDVQITALYRQFYKDMSKNERPFVTSFNVQERAMTAWGVDAAGGPLSIPVMARKSDFKETPATNTVAKAPKPAEPETPPAPKKAPLAPIIVKGPISKPATATNSPATNTNSAPAIVPKTIPPTPTTPPEVKTTPAPVPAVSAPEVKAAPPKVAVVEQLPKAPTPAPTPKPAEVTPATVPSPAPKTTAPEPVVASTPSRPPETVQPAVPVAPQAEAPKAAVAKTEPPKVEPVRIETPKVEVTKVEEKTSPATTIAPPVSSSPPATTAPAQVAGKTVDSAAQLAQTAVAVPPAAGPDWLKLGVGLLFLAGAILAAYLLTRRHQPAHGSVISQSMKRDGR